MNNFYDTEMSASDYVNDHQLLLLSMSGPQALKLTTYACASLTPEICNLVLKSKHCGKVLVPTETGTELLWIDPIPRKGFSI